MLWYRFIGIFYLIFIVVGIFIGASTVEVGIFTVLGLLGCGIADIRDDIKEMQR